MRFLQRVRFDYLRAAMLGLWLGGFAVFWPVRYLVHAEYDGELLEMQAPAEALLLERGRVPDTLFVFATRIEVRPGGVLAQAVFTDTLAYDPLDKEPEPYRKLTYGATLGGAPVTISVAMPSAESEDLVLLLVLSIVGTALAVLLITGLVTRRLARRLWQPFTRSLEALRSYEIGRSAPLDLPPEPITEFAQLNLALNSMAARLEDDFAQLKAFTGRASHELQTPLAVIGTQLDLLLQAPELDADSTRLLTTAVSALQRLRDLHRALLTLTRIEAASRSGDKATTVDVTATILRTLDAYREQSEARDLKWETAMMPYSLTVEPGMLDIVLRNLIGNAVKYARTGSTIRVQLTPKPASGAKLSIHNEGPEAALDLPRVFDAFYRGPDSKQQPGFGLGLAMVAEVARHYGWAVAYRQDGAGHEVEMEFRNHTAAHAG